MIQNTVPGLFGIINSNRDYTKAETWGKNQFNSSFSVSLACYLYHKGMDAVYVKTDPLMNAAIDYISVSKLFNINPLEKNAYFAFETSYTPFQKYVIGSIPRNDIAELTMPRIRKDEIKKIILGGGQNLLSPEKRFDAIIYNSPGLFKEVLA